MYKHVQCDVQKNTTFSLNKKKGNDKYKEVKKMRKFNDLADVNMILTAVVAAIVFAISIAIVYAVLGGISYTTYDAALSGTPAANASNNLIANLNTFYNLGPIYIVVVAAVGIIAAVLMVRGR